MRCQRWCLIYYCQMNSATSEVIFSTSIQLLRGEDHAWLLAVLRIVVGAE